MPVIDLKNNLPGMGSLIAYRNETGYPLAQFVEAVLNGNSDLSRAERELISAFVSFKNNCQYCLRSHGWVAAKLMNLQYDDVLNIFSSPEKSENRISVLLRIAEAVRVINAEESARLVKEAKEAGISEQGCHDAVLTASVACLFNRYIDMMQAPVPTDEAFYLMIADRLISKGYAGTGQRQ
ncbi:MAG TPA: carboxymuconolactone decarboxylase family protein [Bacteroidia bacterium]|nr:carboxymuconolactone decarboxylase family protein [Bacteroidia bacterium]HRS58433.1 carboxymuconolactone decarboxylase family protein [Bacteroidia bacterium]HRU68433.1 carboxymuconolactone decarboxylase family protein [Bacteroidia bacterium]